MERGLRLRWHSLLCNDGKKRKGYDVKFLEKFYWLQKEGAGFAGGKII